MRGDVCGCCCLAMGVVLLLQAQVFAASTAPATSATRTVYHDVTHTGHVVLERDAGGVVLGTPHRYSPYGVLLGDDPVPQEAPRFGGKLRDATSGLDDVHARHYQHEYGRFLSVDPAQDGSHYYAFGNNNPLKYTDSTGTVAAAPLLFGAVAIGGFVYDYCGEAATHLGYSYGTGTATWTTLRGGLEAALCVGEFIGPGKLAQRASGWLSDRLGYRVFRMGTSGRRGGQAVIPAFRRRPLKVVDTQLPALLERHGLTHLGSTEQGIHAAFTAIKGRQCAVYDQLDRTRRYMNGINEQLHEISSLRARQRDMLEQRFGRLQEKRIGLLDELELLSKDMRLLRDVFRLNHLRLLRYRGRPRAIRRRARDMLRHRPR